MTYQIVWMCAELVRRQLEAAYFLDLLDDGETAPEVYIVGTVKRQRQPERFVWQDRRAGARA
jgi:hypothetical protein